MFMYGVRGSLIHPLHSFGAQWDGRVNSLEWAACRWANFNVASPELTPLDPIACPAPILATLDFRKNSNLIRLETSADSCVTKFGPSWCHQPIFRSTFSPRIQMLISPEHQIAVCPIDGCAGASLTKFVYGLIGKPFKSWNQSVVADIATRSLPSTSWLIEEHWQAMMHAANWTKVSGSC